MLNRLCIFKYDVRFWFDKNNARIFSCHFLKSNFFLHESIPMKMQHWSTFVIKVVSLLEVD